MNKLLIYVVVFALLCAATISALPYSMNADGRAPLRVSADSDYAGRCCVACYWYCWCCYA
ncbi:unnamed protein product [Clavelina lepadiformis]|uniref:Uncharacterized protein n=1 Tax=Clavelina lepadiformis TaxID=159417 RepID=A0ABP0EYX2_CLALP